MEDQTVPLSDKDIKARKDMFVRSIVDAATTYGNKGQSCAGGTYNKLFESLSGLHPSVVITLDEKEASKMVEETITQGLPVIAREVLNKFSEREQKTIRKSFAGPSELSTETVMFITAVRAALEEKCKKFSSKLDSDKQKEILKTCMSNLSYIKLGHPNQMAR
ncbi:MAG: hypothetical protein ACR5KX_04990 [Wolbachia sp.]